MFCIKETKQGKPPSQETLELRQKLQDFYKDIQIEINLSKLHIDNNVLKYSSLDIFIHYKVNIQQNFIKYLHKFIKLHFPDKKDYKIRQEILDNFISNSDTNNFVNEYKDYLKKIIYFMI